MLMLINLTTKNPKLSVSLSMQQDINRSQNTTWKTITINQQSIIALRWNTQIDDQVTRTLLEK